MITVQPIPALKDNYIWAIIEGENAIIVDPGDAKPVLNYLNQHKLRLKGIFITHHHWDHTNGSKEIISHYPVPVFGSAHEKTPQVSMPLKDKQKITVEDSSLSFEIIAIPGHTLGHIAFYTPEILFCGDTLFASGCGRIFEGTPEQMYQSLQKLAALPPETKIYCGHEYTLQNLRFAQQVEPDNKKISEYFKKVEMIRQQNLPSLPSTMAIEKESNPFLRCDSPTLIKNVEAYAGQQLKTPVEVFASLRRWKDNF